MEWSQRAWHWLSLMLASCHLFARTSCAFLLVTISRVFDGRLAGRGDQPAGAAPGDQPGGAGRHCRVPSLPDLQQKPTVESRMQSESEGTMMAASSYQAYPL